MRDYFLNVRGAYRQPIEQFFNSVKSSSAVKKSDSDVHDLGMNTLKLCALPFLTASAYIIGKVAYTRQFSYKGLLLAGTTFSIGHDLSKIGDVYDKEFFICQKKDKKPDVLIDALTWIIPKFISTESANEDTAESANENQGNSIKSKVTEALDGTIAENIELVVTDFILG